MGRRARRTEVLPERRSELHSQQLVDSTITGPEVSVLHIADQVLRKDRKAARKAIGHVQAAAEALLLRAVEIERGAADDGPVEIDAEHQVRCETSAHTSEVVPAVGANEVSDDVPARPVTAHELIVVVRFG